MKNKLPYTFLRAILLVVFYFLALYIYQVVLIPTDTPLDELNAENESSQSATEENITVNTAQENKDRFEDFPVEEQKLFGQAPLDLKSHPIGLEFKTVISDAYKQGPNFAGHYTVVIWGCGTSCQEFTIIDDLTGKIYGDYITEKLTDGNLSYGLDFNIKSSLLVINSPDSPERDADSESYPARYYQWGNNRLLPLAVDNKEVE